MPLLVLVPTHARWCMGLSLFAYIVPGQVSGVGASTFGDLLEGLTDPRGVMPRDTESPCRKDTQQVEPRGVRVAPAVLPPGGSPQSTVSLQQWDAARAQCCPGGLLGTQSPLFLHGLVMYVGTTLPAVVTEMPAS